ICCCSGRWAEEKRDHPNQGTTKSRGIVGGTMDITFENVSYIYQAGSPFAHRALTDLSFYIPSGSFVAIIGHTGSVKSTLIQHLNGLVRPSSGRVSIGDYHLSPDKKPKQMKALRSKVGVVFQYPEHQLFEESVEKDIAF